ncbi:MAG: Sca4 family spreading effector [Rickettsia endosymbiont of Glossina mortisans submortisans]|nr:Sca4 family spreading effector [Rickettsia endosymbiont of Glossina mortisans submortisans]
MQEHHNHQEKSVSELLKEFKTKYNIQESNKENITESYKSDNVLQEQVTEETTVQDSVSFGTSGVGINLNSEEVDPITESIRKEILQKQREQLRLYLATLSDTHPELAEHILDDERFKKFLANLNGEHRLLVNDALENEKVKAAMEEIEIVGYRNIHTRFSSSNYPGGFKHMDWSQEGELNIRLQIVQNEAGTKIATLKEQTHKTSPLTISKQDGSRVIVNSYRTIDFPVKLEEPASGTMHLSLVAKDKDGQAPSVTKAVYFTAHYEATPKPNGVPKLKEVSSPQPIKFLGSNFDAIGYIEHGGEIYTLPVTKGKYEEMMKEIAKNQGQAVDLSLAVESKAQDLISSIEQVSGAEIKRVTGEGLVKSGLAKKLDEETINNATDLNVEQIKHHKAQLTKYKKILEEHIEPALKCRDKEREQILLLTKQCLTDSKHKQFEPYIKQTAEQHIKLHHEAYLKEADGGKSLTELTEIMNNIGYKSFTSENSQDSSRGAAGKIKDVLKAGGRLGFNVVLESLKAGGVENYVKQKAIEESKKVGSYVANSIADRIKATLSGKAQNSASTSSSAAIKQNVIGMNGNTSKSLGVGR